MKLNFKNINFKFILKKKINRKIKDLKNLKIYGNEK